LRVAVGEKFSCFAFSRCAVGDDLGDGLALGNGLAVGRTLGLDIGQHWPAWLGSLAMDEMREISFVIHATAPAAHPEVLDGENQALTRACDYVWYGLLLQGVPSYMEGFTLTGANVAGEIQVRQFGHVRDYEPTYEMPEFRLDAGAAKLAALLGERLGRIDVLGSPPWGRLRRGLRALFRGSKEGDGGDRLHEFVRALEAVVRPDIGNTRNQFAHRAQTFATASPRARESLLQIFDLRSHVEHMHLAIAALEGAEKDRIAVANHRTRQVDALARFVFRHVLESDALLEIFRTEEGIERFWALPDDERTRAWGARLDLAGIR